MTRVPQWPENLVTYLEARRFVPFAWGSNDCGLFCADGIIEMTGVDPVPALRGYKTERGALLKIRRAGGMQQIAVNAGFIEKPAGFAHRGEVVLADMLGRETFGLVAGNGYWCAPGAEQLEFRPMSEALKVFGF